MSVKLKFNSLCMTTALKRIKSLNKKYVEISSLMQQHSALESVCSNIDMEQDNKGPPLRGSLIGMHLTQVIAPPLVRVCADTSMIYTVKTKQT